MGNCNYNKEIFLQNMTKSIDVKSNLKLLVTSKLYLYKHIVIKLPK